MAREPEAPPTTYERIWRTVAAIPAGTVATYGQIADLAGFPRGGRLVGTALRRAPDDAALPWHRVINARGRLSFPPDSRQYRLQTRRLRAEGVPCIGGRVDLVRYGWSQPLDALLWGP